MKPLCLLLATLAWAAALRLPNPVMYQHAERARMKSASLFSSQDIPVPDYKWNTSYFVQDLDHFNFVNRVSGERPASGWLLQRYLVNDQYWNPGGVQPDGSITPPGPMFFYTGNEGDIITFANNTGFMWENAPNFGAMVVFAEHRYYGESMPYNQSVNTTYSQPDNLQYLTAEQALADFAILIDHIKQGYNSTTMPVIAFGGSYGGMLTAWFRIKYPHKVIGGIAASAPIWQFTDLTGDEEFSKRASRDYELVSPACSEGIRRSWGILNNMATTLDGLNFISNTFQLCTPLVSQSQVSQQLFPWISNALTYMPMANYPYPANFLGPMPAWPVTVSCSLFTSLNMDNNSTIVALKAAVDVFYNYTGWNGPCYATSTNEPSTLGDAGGWPYQSCTEMVMPIGQNNVDDIFYYAPWNLTADLQQCQQQYDLTPRTNWIIQNFGGRFELSKSGVTNIVFSNGDLDPWAGGGVLANLSDSLVSIYISQSAHHLDLRESNPADPQSVRDARQFELFFIKKWLSEYYGHATPTKPVSGDDSKFGWGIVLLLGVICGIAATLALYCFYTNERCRRFREGAGRERGPAVGDAPYRYVA